MDIQTMHQICTADLGIFEDKPGHQTKPSSNRRHAEPGQGAIPTNTGRENARNAASKSLSEHSSPSFLPLSAHPGTSFYLWRDSIRLGPTSFIALNFYSAASPPLVRNIWTRVCARALTRSSSTSISALMTGLGHHAHTRRRLWRTRYLVVVRH